MRQFFDTGSPLLNLVNGFSESLKTIPPDELLDKDSREIIKIDGRELLMSALEEAHRRKANREIKHVNKFRE